MTVRVADLRAAIERADSPLIETAIALVTPEGRTVSAFDGLAGYGNAKFLRYVTGYNADAAGDWTISAEQRANTEDQMMASEIGPGLVAWDGAQVVKASCGGAPFALDRIRIAKDQHGPVILLDMKGD